MGSRKLKINPHVSKEDDKDASQFPWSQLSNSNEEEPSLWFVSDIKLVNLANALKKKLFDSSDGDKKLALKSCMSRILIQESAKVSTALELRTTYNMNYRYSTECQSIALLIYGRI